MSDPTSEHLDRLRESLGERAAATGELDVAVRETDSPIGRLLLAATGEGIVRVAFAEVEGPAVLDDLARRVGPRILTAPSRLEEATRQLGEYLEGRRRTLDLPLDLRLARGYRREVVTALRGIGYGDTASYAELATRTGHPRAVRAVGTACATNPLPLVLPCHRVVRSDGSLGQYLGGVEVKRRLLDLEAAG